MKNLKGTKTEENLKKAFAGESQARNKYTYFAERAREEDYQQIANIFDMTADNEKEHGKQWYRLLYGIGDTKENLEKAADGEAEEGTSMYPRMAKEAEAEGFTEIARLFREVAEIELAHDKRFRKLLTNIETGAVFHRAENTTWMCLNCGYLHTGADAPEICPFCGYPQGFFEINPKNY